MTICPMPTSSEAMSPTQCTPISFWLSPGKVTPRSSDEAFQLLAKASQYQADANLCDSFANQVYSAWLARRNNDRLNAASRILEDERKRLEWNARLTAGGTQTRQQRRRKILLLLEKGRIGLPPSAPGGAAAPTTTQPRHANAAHIDAACEVTALTRANHLKREVA